MNPLIYQLKQIGKFMAEAKVDYAIIGGLAVSIYSEPRLTLDIDVNILLDTARLEEFLKTAKK